MDSKSMELAAPLQSLPPVEFCCAMDPLLSNNHDKTSMMDYIFGVRDPLKWHSQNLEMNRHRYSKWMGALGPKSVTCVADRIGVGVHFNPFVQWREKMVKYGVVGIQDLAWDVLTWDKFYLSSRLQKPDYGLSAATSLFSMLPWSIQRHMQSKLRSMETGSTISQILVPSRKEAANCISKALRRKVMVQSGRQAVSAFLAVGGVNSVRYLAKKMSKAWRSRI